MTSSPCPCSSSRSSNSLPPLIGSARSMAFIASMGPWLLAFRICRRPTRGALPLSAPFQRCTNAPDLFSENRGDGTESPGHAAPSVKRLQSSSPGANRRAEPASTLHWRRAYGSRLSEHIRTLCSVLHSKCAKQIPPDVRGFSKPAPKGQRTTNGRAKRAPHIGARSTGQPIERGGWHAGGELAAVSN